MKPLLLVLLLTAGAGPLAAQYRPAGFMGIEGGVMQFYSPKLNGPSGAIRVGSALDRRGLLRASGALSLGYAYQSFYLMAVGHLEFRPLSPRRFSPIIGIGGLITISIFSSLERTALGGTASAVALWLTLAALFAVLRYRRGRQQRNWAEEAPDFYPSEMATLDLTSAS